MSPLAEEQNIDKRSADCLAKYGPKAKKCLQCSTIIPPSRIESHPSIMFCSPACQREFHIPNRAKERKLIPKGDLGSVSELLVCADLINRGFMVFRVVHPHSPFDLIAVPRKNPTQRIAIEVKTGYKLRNGQIYHAKPTQKQEVADFLAIAFPSNEVEYKALNSHIIDEK